MDENQLIKKVQSGETEEYRHLISLHQNLIYRIISKQGLKHDIAEDLAQETFIKAFRGIRSFRFESKFSTWLIRIALNVTNAYFHSKEFKNQRSAETGRNQIEIQHLKSPEDIALDRELFGKLYSCLSKLKDKFREALVLVALDGQSYEFVAELSGVPIGTVRSRINRARLLLVECMERPMTRGEK